MDGLQQNLNPNSHQASQEFVQNAFFARNRGAKWWLFVAVFYIAAAIATHLMEDVFQVAGLMPTDTHADPSVAGMIIVSIATLVWTTLVSSVSLSILVGPTELSFLKTINLLLIETIRGLGAVLLRVPLLILPAIYEWVRLAPIPYIVVLDSRYQAGEVDALQASREFFQAHWKRVLGLLIISLIILLIEFATTSSPQDAGPLWENPIEALLPILVFSLVHLACDVFTLEMYRRATLHRPKDQRTSP